MRLRITNNEERLTGFTLVELLVAITIMGILSGIGFNSYNQAQKKGRDVQRKSDLKQVKNALELYYNDSGSYPLASANKIQACGDGTQVCEWGAGVLNKGGTVYLKQVPKDPKSSQSYYYESDGTFYRLLATLENDKDPAVISGGTDKNCGTSLVCNFGIASPGTKIATTASTTTGTTVPTATTAPLPTATSAPAAAATPISTPTPTPTGPCSTVPSLTSTGNSTCWTQSTVASPIYVACPPANSSEQTVLNECASEVVEAACRTSSFQYATSAAGVLTNQIYIATDNCGGQVPNQITIRLGGVAPTPTPTPTPTPVPVLTDTQRNQQRKDDLASYAAGLGRYKDLKGGYPRWADASGYQLGILCGGKLKPAGAMTTCPTDPSNYDWYKYASDGQVQPWYSQVNYDLADVATKFVLWVRLETISGYLFWVHCSDGRTGTLGNVLFTNGQCPL